MQAYLEENCHLEFAEHTLLAVDRGGLAHQQSLGQVLLVEGLEHILPVDKPDTTAGSYLSVLTTVVDPE
jgi:hypothetical protein